MNKIVTVFYFIESADGTLYVDQCKIAIESLQIV